MKILIKKNIKLILKLILPKRLFLILKEKKSNFIELKRVYTIYHKDLKRFYKYSDFKNKQSKINLIGLIIRKYHVIEKGLTMPQTKLGFGKEMIVSLCHDCKCYIENYGKNDEQLIQALSVLIEYKDFHKKNLYSLEFSLIEVIDELMKLAEFSEISEQKSFTKDLYFSNSNADFNIFSNSRSSIRNFSDQNIPFSTIESVIDLAKNAPSACNRQSWRTYIFSDEKMIEKILVKQGGNRGFGHLTNKLIIITSELGLFSGINERNQAYIDGGIYAMNLLYSLHHHQIAACILNCSFSQKIDDEIRELGYIKKSEVFIAMIACGIPPENFEAAASLRYKIEETNTFVN